MKQSMMVPGKEDGCLMSVTNKNKQNLMRLFTLYALENLLSPPLLYLCFPPTKSMRSCVTLIHHVIYLYGEYRVHKLQSMEYLIILYASLFCSQNSPTFLWHKHTRSHWFCWEFPQSNRISVREDYWTRMYKNTIQPLLILGSHWKALVIGWH